MIDRTQLRKKRKRLDERKRTSFRRGVSPLQAAMIDWKRMAIEREREFELAALNSVTSTMIPPRIIGS